MRCLDQNKWKLIDFSDTVRHEDIRDAYHRFRKFTTSIDSCRCQQLLSVRSSAPSSATSSEACLPACSCCYNNTKVRLGIVRDYLMPNASTLECELGCSCCLPTIGKMMELSCTFRHADVILCSVLALVHNLSVIVDTFQDHATIFRVGTYPDLGS